MAIAITLGAAAGEYMESATLVEWRVAEGDGVAAGDVIAVVETAKASTEVEAPGDGYLVRILADTGAEVEVRATLGYIADRPDAAVPERGGPLSAGETHADGQEDTDRQEDTDGEEDGDQAVLDRHDGGGQSGRVPVSPAARRRAIQAGLDPSELVPSSPHGRVKLRDVEAAREARGAGGDSASDAASASPGPLACDTSGPADGTPLVLLHGLAADSTIWHAVRSCLQPPGPVIAVDLPAHGRSSDHVPDGVASLVQVVDATLRARTDGPVHLLGHSLGGALAIAFAARSPSRIRSLTVIAPAGLGADIDGAVLDGLLRASRPESLKPWLARLVADETLVTDAFAGAAMAGRANAERRTAQRRLADLLFPDGTQALDLRRELAGLDASIRLVWGRSDGLVPWRHALGAPAHAALHLVPGVGHMPHLEAPETVARVLEAVVAESAADPGRTTVGAEA